MIYARNNRNIFVRFDERAWHFVLIRHLFGWSLSITQGDYLVCNDGYWKVTSNRRLVYLRDVTEENPLRWFASLDPVTFLVQLML